MRRNAGGYGCPCGACAHGGVCPPLPQVAFLTLLEKYVLCNFGLIFLQGMLLLPVHALVSHPVWRHMGVLLDRVIIGLCVLWLVLVHCWVAYARWRTQPRNLVLAKGIPVRSMVPGCCPPPRAAPLLALGHALSHIVSRALA